MDAQRWRQLKDALAPALELPVDERRAYLEAHCEPELLPQALTLLDAYRDEDFLEHPAQASSMPPTESIGPYRLVELLGTGGMGEVYLAQQEEPIRRRVAVKLMRASFLGETAAARFHVERQALARMQHPNIARVFDAGEVALDPAFSSPEVKRPYFVMELIDGSAITRYCEERQLDLEARLDLFVQVCRGVQHAHQKGIVHRDLKPSNVLVVEEDGRPVPKIIDFGIAKAIVDLEAPTPGAVDVAVAPTVEGSRLTAAGQWLGTPEYMSPEQAQGDEVGVVDTRSDVYSLGVLLYELLTGQQPFDPPELDAANPLEARRQRMLDILHQRAPEPPSRKAVADGPVAARRLRGDLDAIVLEAMEPKPEHRYASVTELAADIERFQRDEPVVAAPDSRGYRWGKFVRRHRWGVVVALLVALSLGAGLAAATVGLLRAREAEGLAQEQAQRAEEKAEIAQQTSQFLFEIFEAAHPSRAPRPDITLREVLDRSAERVHEKLADQPAVQAQLLFTMGRSYHGLGLYERAREMVEASLEVRQRHFGDDHLLVADSQHILTSIYLDLAQLDAAEVSARRALELREKHLGPDHPLVAASLNNLALIFKRRGDTEAARVGLERALRIYEANGAPPRDIAAALDNIGLLLAESGQPGPARPYLERALALLEAEHGKDSPRISGALNNLALAQVELGDRDGARQLWCRALEIDRRSYGDTHPFVAYGHYNLGKLSEEMGQCGEATEHLAAAVEILRQRLASDHPRLRAASADLAALPQTCVDAEP